MTNFIIHGWTKGGEYRVVYAGTDGQAALAAARQAQQSCEFAPHRLWRLNNATGTPLPTVPEPGQSAPVQTVKMNRKKN